VSDGKGHVCEIECPTKQCDPSLCESFFVLADAVVGAKVRGLSERDRERKGRLVEIKLFCGDVILARRLLQLGEIDLQVDTCV
jgi:hypothetical protein